MFSLFEPEARARAQIWNPKSEIESLWTNDSERGNIPKMKTGRNFIFSWKVSYKGTKILVDKGIKANQALIAEPSDLAINIAHKGDLGLELIIQGKTAHAANPSEGINACPPVHFSFILFMDISLRIQLHHSR